MNHQIFLTMYALMTEIAIDEDQLQYLKDCESILKQLYPDKLPNVPFICGIIGEFSEKTRAETVWVVPYFGCDYAIPYVKYDLKSD